MKRIATTALAVICCSLGEAQSLVDRVADFAKAPTDKGAEGQVQGIVEHAITEAWPELTSVLNEGRPFARPPVLATPVSLEREAPRFDGHNLVFPSTYLAVMESICTYATHDVLTVNQQFFTHTWSAPANKPFGESAIWPLLDDPVQEVVSPDFQAMTGLLNCPKDVELCNSVHNAARAGLLLFLVGHELNHAARGDVLPPDGHYPLDFEKAADANAIKLLNLVEKEQGKMSALQQLALYLGPLMVLDLEASAARSGDDRQVLTARRNAVAAEMPVGLRPQAEKMAIAKVERTGFGKVRFDLKEQPDSLWVDGVRASELDLNRDLTFVSGVHWVVAWKGASLACAKLAVLDGPNVFKLRFDKLPSGQPATPDKLSAMAHGDDWCGVLFEVAGSANGPKDPNLAAWWSEARRRLLLAERGLPVSLQFHAAAQ